MEKRIYEKPVLQVEQFITNDYVAGCAKYNIKLTCTWPTNENGYTYDTGDYTKADNMQHGTGWGGACTVTITEFSAFEQHGGTYNNDLAMNGTSLTDYAAIRKYLDDKNEYSGSGAPSSTDSYYQYATWTSGNSTGVYKHKGYLTFTKITGEAANKS